MMSVLEELKTRNELLFWFGLLHFGLAVLFSFLSTLPFEKVAGSNAWYKPIKFALSIGIYVWSVAWLMAYLPAFGTKSTSWIMALLFGFEMAYIALQAGKGQMSHYNISTPFRHTLFMLMALAAAFISFYTAQLGWIFWTRSFPDLSYSYLWGIRLGILLFVLFSLQGFLMGSRLSHTVGAPDGGPGIPFLGWSITAGDLRMAHFLGMHGLQVLPFIGWLTGELRWPIWMVFLFYFLVCLASLVLALKGKSPFSLNITKGASTIEKIKLQGNRSHFYMEPPGRTKPVG